ncbi:nitrous oxide-stimulated promoter family protein [Culturomica massiliensis]|uniref:nitrous oxide-stimulated promoter family protein n=1 Tax=Culturomica massiliensis TaxID=1841857 RepID=UPI00093BDB5D|nr:MULTISPECIES: nitrous oxide-stimulated promoter family protein [Odoribacteraceae]RHV94706.1 nitrous oxide-stimulated promoter family protein [Odoribacter sp. OF09-27XD]
MDKIQKEKKIIATMIRLYCRKREKNAELCPECRVLLEYAHKRLELCPFGESKTSCKHCTIHCYRPEMREKIRKVMRYSGPRMLLYHPWVAIKHFF